jgi:hypothetical protein
MKAIQLESQVDDKGVLSLQVLLGPNEARSRVLVTIESASRDRSAPERDESDWHQFVQGTYGSCAGLGLEEPPDLPLQRCEWPE